MHEATIAKTALLEVEIQLKAVEVAHTEALAGPEIAVPLAQEVSTSISVSQLVQLS